MTEKLGRNDRCHCGSGRKYKHCCLPMENTDLTPEQARSVITEALSKMENSGPYLHAFNKLGFLVTDQNIDRVPAEMLEEWNAAIEEYLDEHPEERDKLEQGSEELPYDGQSEVENAELDGLHAQDSE